MQSQCNGTHTRMAMLSTMRIPTALIKLGGISREIVEEHAPYHIADGDRWFISEIANYIWHTSYLQTGQEVIHFIIIIFLQVTFETIPSKTELQNNRPDRVVKPNLLHEALARF